jgi:hypothetical protein
MRILTAGVLHLSFRDRSQTNVSPTKIDPLNGSEGRVLQKTSLVVSDDLWAMHSSSDRRISAGVSNEVFRLLPHHFANIIL